MENLTSYIKKAREQGATDVEIAAALLRTGWQEHQFAEALFGHKSEAVPPPPPESIIHVEGVAKNYGKVSALQGVNLNVRKGSVTALLGPNGAGKTTLIRILTTLLTQDSGRVNVAGFELPRQAQALRREIGLSGQAAAVDEILTGRENLEIVGRLYHFSRAAARARALELLQQFDLLEAGDRILKTYSGGMRRRLDLAASLVAKPKILFLDEPTTGLDPRSRFSLWSVIRDLVAGGTTVLLTTQYLEEADQLADKIFVINHGKIIAEGTPAELKQRVGGEILELHVGQHADAAKAAALIQKFARETPEADTQTGIVAVPVHGTKILPDVLREIDGAGIQLLDMRLRGPTLDDVFMKLTGHAAE